MKKLMFVLFAGLACLGFAACSDSDDENGSANLKAGDCCNPENYRKVCSGKYVVLTCDTSAFWLKDTQCKEGVVVNSLCVDPNTCQEDETEGVACK